MLSAYRIYRAPHQGREAPLCARRAAPCRKAGHARARGNLIRVGREAARGREKGAAARKVKNLFLVHYQHTTQRTLQNFAFSRRDKNPCSTFALSMDDNASFGCGATSRNSLGEGVISPIGTEVIRRDFAVSVDTNSVLWLIVQKSREAYAEKIVGLR